MSNTKHSEVTFTNADTIRKRAWIDKALASVRGRFTGSETAVEAPEMPARPNLYVVDPDQPR